MLTIHYKQTGKKSFIYRLKGSQAELEQYLDDQIESGLNESSFIDEETGGYLFFISKNSDFQPSGTQIVRKENEDGTVRYWPNDSEQSIIARQALEKAALRAFGISGASQQSTTETETPSEESDNADLEKPAPTKRVAKPNRRIGSK